MQRSYTVAEIDQMRRDVREMNGDGYGSLSVAEEILRTYMLNGTEPAELTEAAHRLRETRRVRNDMSRGLSRDAQRLGSRF